MSGAPGAVIDVLAVGVVTPVGLSAASATAALRAGIARTAASSVLRPDGTRQVMGLVAEDHLPPLHERLAGRALTAAAMRRLRLATFALREALADRREPVTLLLATPDAPPHAPADRASTVRTVEALALQAGVALDPVASAAFAHGHASVFFALAAARERLVSGLVEQVLVGGADTLLDLRRLAELEDQQRLLGEGVGDGFVPGEGAAFLLLGLAGGRAGEARRPLARLVGIGLGHEPGHRGSERPYRGDGLADALRAACAGRPNGGPRIEVVHTGLNGEGLGAKEWGVAHTRQARQLAPGLTTLHPVEAIGDPGVALGPLLVAQAAVALARGHTAGPALAWCSSDGPERGAAVLEAA